MAKRKGQERTADGVAGTSSISTISSHTFLIAADEVMNGANWLTDSEFNSAAITSLFNSMDWWQGQIDMCQLAVETVQDRMTDYAKLLGEHMTSKRPEQVAVMQSMIETTKAQLENYKRWEDICIGQMRKIGMRSRSAKAGGLPIG